MTNPWKIRVLISFFFFHFADVPTTYTFYWVGATVPAEKGATTCDTVLRKKTIKIVLF